LDCEQTVNERLGANRGVRRLSLSSHTVAARYHPERREVWPQEVVWLPRGSVRMYGPVESALEAAFGRPTPPGRAPLLLHPQAPAAHRRLRVAHGSTTLEGVWTTPTASIRTVVAWRGGYRPVLLKLSLGAAIGRLRRSITEYYLVTGILVSHLLETIPHSVRRRLGLDWFPEPAGAVDAASGTGWILRHFPALMTEAKAGDLVPGFSLIAPRGDDAPLLVELIRQAGVRPEEFVVERLLKPYVKVLAHLLLEEGIQLQGHAQNILLEVDRSRGLTGRIVVRDLVDSSVSVALRLAKGKALPRLGPGLLPRRTPFPLVRSAIDYRGSAGRRWPVAAADTVERWGLAAFVWSVNVSVARYFRRYDAGRVERAYLRLWRDDVIRHLGVEPLISEKPRGLATDEALTYYLSHLDWEAAGARHGATLPGAAEPLPHHGVLRRRGGPVYQRIESAWGDLYLDRGSPAFFRPAF
jgi:hypothetical protein